MIWVLLSCTREKPADEPSFVDTGKSDPTETLSNTTETTPSTTSEPSLTEQPQIADLVVSIHPDVESLVVVEWTQTDPAMATVWWSLDGTTWTQTPTKATATGNMSQIVAGAPYDTPVSVRLSLAWDEGVVDSEAVMVTTGEMPANLVAPTLLSGDPDKWDAQAPFHLVSLSEADLWDSWWAVILDRQARVVWAQASQPGEAMMYPRVALDGASLLLDGNTFWGSFDDGVGSRIYRLKLDGTVVDTLLTPGLRHAWAELPDGSLSWSAVERSSGTYDEVVTNLDLDGNLTELWSCQWFLARQGADENCGSNTLFFDKRTGHYLVSFFTFETVVEVDPAKGQAVRWFGHLDDEWVFSPEESIFWWQHGVHYTPSGTLLVSSRAARNADETVVREYVFDERAQTLTEVWSFGSGEGVYGAQMGEAWRLPGGNILHNYGTLPRLREATWEGEVVWDVAWDGDRNIGHSTAIMDLYALLP